MLAFVSAHCGEVVRPTDAGPDSSIGADVIANADTAVADSAVTVDVMALDSGPTLNCAQVQSTCTTAPQQFVRGHAEGLVGVDGARVQFAVRFVLVEGMGLTGARGVVTARAIIQGGSFEACLCVPRGANNYPEIAAVVFAPGSTGELGRDAVRGTFSQRFATLGDEDFSMSLVEPLTPVQAETAVAGMVDRYTQIRVLRLDASVEGLPAYMGLIADERPFTAMVGHGAVEAGELRSEWGLPGREWPSERLVIVLDRNANHMCDAADLGASVPVERRSEIMGIGGAWLEGAAIAPLCNALSLDQPRGM